MSTVALQYAGVDPLAGTSAALVTREPSANTSSANVAHARTGCDPPVPALAAGPGTAPSANAPAAVRAPTPALRARRDQLLIPLPPRLRTDTRRPLSPYSA